MTGIDNSFVAKYVAFKRDGLNNQELNELKHDAKAQAYTTEAAHKLTSEIIKDGKIDQDEQKLLQMIGQGAKDISVAQKYCAAMDPTNSQISSLIMMGFKSKQIQSQNLSEKPVKDMNIQEKLVSALQKSIKYVGPELRSKIETMMTPENINKMAVAIGAYAALHAGGVGFIADAALFTIGAFTLGTDAIDVVKKVYGFVSGAIDAKSNNDLELAAEQLGKGIATIISDIPAIIGLKGAKISTRNISANIGGPSFAVAGGRVLAAENIFTVVVPVIKLSKAQAAAIGGSVMMSKASGTGGGDKYNYQNGRYKDADYHSSKDNSVKSRKPTDGQDALDKSVQVKTTSPRRVSVSKGEFVVLDQTVEGEFHGHVRAWADLDVQMQNALIKLGVVSRKGKII